VRERSAASRQLSTSREILRQRYRPATITTLFIAESPPAEKANFFYSESGTLYRHMKLAFGGGDDFLDDFAAKGFYLDDLVLVPVNRLAGPERRRLHRASVSSLARRLRSHRPKAVVVLLKSIARAVEAALADAGLAHMPRHVVPYPGMGNQPRFLAAMAQIVPTLPVANERRYAR
jgi:hypothetical protein